MSIDVIGKSSIKPASLCIEPTPQSSREHAIATNGVSNMEKGGDVAVATAAAAAAAIRLPAAASARRGPPQMCVHLALLLGQAINGGGAIVAKVGLPQMNPVFFAFLREALGTPILACIALAVDGWPSCHWQDIPIILCAAFALFCGQGLWVVGLKLANPVIGAALQPSQPILVLGIAVLLRLEVCSGLKSVGIIFALVGAAAMTLAGPETAIEFDSDGTELVGNLMFFGNCVATAVFILLMRVLVVRITAYAALAMVYVATTLIFASAAIVVSNEPDLQEFLCPECTGGFWHLPAGGLAAVVYFVLGNSVICYFLLAFGAKHARDPSHCLAYTAVQPVIAGISEAVLVAMGWNSSHPDNQLVVPDELQASGAIGVVIGIACIALDAGLEPRTAMMDAKGSFARVPQKDS